MEKYFGEKQERFSFRKLSVGLVSATISSLFFMSVLASSSVDAQETAGVHYKYVADSELSSEEKKQLVYDIPTYVENDDETYYLVYKLNSQNQLAELPNTGSKNERQALVAGASLAALGILIFAVSKKKVKNKTVLHLVLVAGIGNGVLVSVHALENHLLLNYNTDYELTSGEKLPLPKEISGYTYIGYIKEGKTTSDFEVSNQEKSAATPTKQQKVDYNVTPNFVDHPSTVQAIQEQTPVSSTKPTEVQVVEKPFSTELINPRKEEKQSSDSQEQLAEHKNLETKKEEKISPKEKTGVNTLNPQDEVLSGQLNKPELLYREETIETKIDFQEEIQENPDLAEGTVRVKQEGKLGKKVEIVRIFSVNKEEVSREIVSTSTTAPIPRIVEKGTKKTQVIKEQPETGVEHKDVQSGAIVEPAIQPELPEAVVSDKGVPEVQPALPEAVVTDKGEPAVQPELPEAVVTDKGEPEVQPELPEAVVTDKGEPEVQPALPEAVVSDKGEPEQVAPLPEYTRPQAGAVVEPAIQPELPEAVVTDKGEPAVQPELPEAVVTDKGETEVQPESPDTVVSDKGEPKQVAPLPEYTGPQASAIVEPEQVAPLPEYTGVQAGSIVEPEKVEAPKEYTGKIEQPSAEDTKPENEASSTNGESERPKDKIKEEKQVDKKLELRNVSNVELYTVENNKYRHITAVDGALDSSLKYFMKVKSENFKDIMLPVTKIESTTKNNKEVYKIVAHAENLIQHENNVISNDYTYYLPKTQQSETGVYTSFKNLVDAMNSDPNGTFHLGATMDAREVELPDDQESYVKNEFYGKLIGENNGKYYAIYNLKKPLFKTLNTATIQNLSIKEANVSSKEDAATISKEAKYNTLIDNVIQLGKSGFNNLLAKNNVITYNVLLSKNYGTESLFKALEGYRKVFLPTTSNNEWFKAQTKAYIVEEKSSIPEVSKKQSEQGTKYSIGIYDRLTSPSWKYQSMVLPLLTLPEEKTVFMIANISTIGFGAYDRYRSKVHPKGDNLNKFVEDNVREAAKRFRDHYDYWYKILEPENREKLYRSLLVYDAFKFGRDNTEDKVTYQADFETDHPAIKYFFGPAGNNVVHNGHGAYATGDAFYYMAYRMLDKDGAVTYTHEMTHNSDREIYLGGYGRRSGLGPEFYAKGLLQAPDHPYDPTITINSVLKYDDSENSTRLQVADPTQRFNSAEDLHNYMHNMFDLIYTLEILEGRAVAKLDYNAKNDLLRKIENKYKQDPDGNSVYATNVVRRLTMDEVNKLNSFDSLIENDIITSRGYKDQEYKRNGYYTIDLFSPIYSALSGEKGTPGDLMGRRIAFELLAAKGYKEGMVPYISNQYEKDAKAAGSKIKSYGKEVGLVTDKLVLEKVFNNRYSSWVEFKKAMYNERIAKFNNLISVSFNNPNVSWGRTNRITITSIANLQNMINTAVNEDAEDFRAQLYPDTNSRVLKLKKAIYKAYLDQTNDFRRSIFENKK
ncbi:TPA: ZmpA/ZmpB/ZmpC family metallo-endopeptidase [Streptococcus pneumoniae]